MTTTVDMLAHQLQGEVQGDRHLVIHGAQAVTKAGPHDITFLVDERNLRQLKSSRAGAVIVGKSMNDSLGDDAAPPAVIVVDDAQAAFIQVLQQFRPERPRPTIGISSKAIVDPSASIGEDTNVFPGAFIGQDVVIGEGCDIYPGVYIGSACRLGDGVTLHPNVVLYPDVWIRNRVTIHASAVLGADGFGYRFEDGRFVKIPQLGTVHVENDVEIGAGTTIDRGMIDPTVIGEGTKLDNQIMIAHNCELGKHNAYASQVGFAGSVTTGDYVRCGGQVGVADHVHLGDRCSLGGRAGVITDVPAGQIYHGAPARPETEQKKIVLAESKLPEMRKRLRQLESKMTELTRQIEALTSTQVQS